MIEKKKTPAPGKLFSLALLAVLVALVAPGTAGAAGGQKSLTWSQPQHVLSLPTSSGSFQQISPLVQSNGNEYLSYVDNGEDLWLVSQQSGSWQAYAAAPSGSVASGVGTLGAPTVQGGVAYIPYLTANGSVSNPLWLTYDPSGNPNGPWVQVQVVGGCGCGTAPGSSPSHPSAAIVGNTFAIAFGDGPPLGSAKGVGDVYVATAALSDFTTTPGSIPWQITDVTSVDQEQDVKPFLAMDGSNLDLAWEQATQNASGPVSNLMFDRGQLGGATGTTWGPEVLVETQANSWDLSLDLAASQGVDLAGFIDDQPNSGEMDALAATNGSGAWVPSKVGVDANALNDDIPGVAISACGPSLSYVAQVTNPDGSTSPQPTVATLVNGQWNQANIGGELPTVTSYAELAPASTGGLDMVYVTANTELYAATASCGYRVDLPIIFKP